MAPDPERKRGRGRRILGFGLVGLGLLNIIDLFSPFPVPTVGIGAVVAGVICVGAGLSVLYLGKNDWPNLLRRLSSHPPPAGAGERRLADPLVPVRILELARKQGGLLTVSTVAMGLRLPLDVAEEGLGELVRRGVAVEDYDEARNTVVYRFPEFLPPPEGR